MATNNIYLHGSLGRKYGKCFKIDVGTPRQASKAICAQIKELKQEFAATEFRVVRGDLQKGFVLGIEEADMGLGDNDIHFIPVEAIEGRGGRGGGIGKTILGIALLAVAVVTAIPTGGASLGALAAVSTPLFGLSVGTVALLGTTLLLGGVSQLLAPSPKGADVNQNETDQRASFLFNGPVNVSEQGQPVPLVFGQIRTGSIVVSTGIDTVAVSV